MNRFGGMAALLGCIYLALLLGLSEYTTYEEDPVSHFLGTRDITFVLSSPSFSGSSLLHFDQHQEGQISQYYQYLLHVNIMVCGLCESYIPVPKESELRKLRLDR